MKNKVEDLRNHLFEQLERLNDDELKGEELKKELQRAKAISQIGSVIVNSAKVEVDYIKLIGGRDTTTDFLKKTGENILNLDSENDQD